MVKPSACDVEADRPVEAERRRARFDGFGSAVHRHTCIATYNEHGINVSIIYHNAGMYLAQISSSWCITYQIVQFRASSTILTVSFIHTTFYGVLSTC